MTDPDPRDDEAATRCEFDVGDLWDWFDRGDSDVTNGEMIESHLAECPICQARMRSMQGLHGALEGLKSEEDLLPERIGPYRVLRQIGHGGMGVVYEAHQATPARSVAVKVMRPSAVESDRRLRSFRREIETLGRLSHPSIATVFDAGRTDDGQLYLVMELVRGVTVDAYCDQHGTGVRDRVELVAKIAEAVHHAHENGVIHRDIKPGNVLVDEGGRPRILDFGLARFLEPSQDVTASPSLTHAPSGTLPYMSPEQLTGDSSAIAAQSDVYSLGVVLYQLLTKHLPYDPQTSVHDMHRVLTYQDARHPAHVVDIARELGDVVMKAIEKERNRRYATAADLAGDLRNFLAGRSVSARPPSVLYRTRVLTRRHWRRAAIAGLVLASLGVALWPRESAAPPHLERVRDPVGLPEPTRMPSDFDFASDGRHLAYVADNHRFIRVWDRVPQTSRDVLLPSNGRYFHPRWSPDAKRIAFIEHRIVDAVESYGVVVLDPASSETRRIHQTSSVTDRPWDCGWLADGSGVVCLRLDGSLFSVSFDGAETPWSTARMDEQHKMRRLGGFSPDGRWLLVDVEEWTVGSNQIANQDVWCIPRRGGRAIRVTFGKDRNRHPIWHPDGTVWFLSNRQSGSSKTFNLWRVAMDVATGQSHGDPEQMSFEESGEKACPRFFDSGRGVVYRVMDGIQVLQCATWDGVRLSGTHTIDRGMEPDLSPNGETIYYLDGAGGPGLFALNRESREVRQLSDHSIVARVLDEYPRFGVRADGGCIAYATPSGTGYEVRIVPTSGVLPDSTVVDTTDMMPTPPRWSPGGKWIAYAADGAIRVVAADGSDRQSLTRIWRWQGVSWSPDGDALAGLGYESPPDKNAEGEDTIEGFVVAFPGGKRTRITQETGYKEWLRWHPGGTFLTYYSNLGSATRRAFPDGRPTELMFDVKDEYDYRGEWTPDGERFLFRCWRYDDDATCPSMIHVWDRTKRQVVQHELMHAYPRFDAKGETLVWSGVGMTGMGYLEFRHGIVR